MAQNDRSGIYLALHLPLQIRISLPIIPYEVNLMSTYSTVVRPKHSTNVSKYSASALVLTMIPYVEVAY